MTTPDYWSLWGLHRVLISSKKIKTRQEIGITKRLAQKEREKYLRVKSKESLGGSFFAGENNDGEILILSDLRTGGHKNFQKS